MKLFNTIEVVKELLSLAREIAQAEGLDDKAALKRALAELPRLATDAHRNVRYRPTAQRAPERRVALSEMRWRPVPPAGK